MLSGSPSLYDDQRTTLRQLGLIPDSNVPSLTVRWFHATDQPIHDPVSSRSEKDITEKTNDPGKKKPENWLPFSKRDSIALEKAYQNNDTQATVPVNEDHLFQVNVKRRTISPVYWEGPTYKVCRATWFIQGDGSNWVPCEEVLADQIELGYRKHKPYLLSLAADGCNAEQETDGSLDKEKKKSEEKLPSQDKSFEDTLRASLVEKQWYLQDSYQNQYIVYTDTNSAWLLSDTIGGNITKTIYTRLTNYHNMGGTLLIRGYPEVEKQTKTAKQTSTHASSKMLNDEIDYAIDMDDKVVDEEALASQREEEDYDNEESEEDVRSIDQLVFVVHGIGQKMSERLGQTLVHDVNILRKTIKSAFPIVIPPTRSVQRQNGVQVLPILWRHEIKFGMASNDEDTSEADMGVPVREDGHPTLDEITPNGVPNIRMVVSDVLLDIPLYMTPKYRDQMAAVITKEINRVYRLFIERNPEFVEKQGKVTVLGHSLGSLLAFDILTTQPFTAAQESYIKTNYTLSAIAHDKKTPPLDFQVHNFFALGSPLGIMLLLRGLKIASRKSLNSSDHQKAGSSSSSVADNLESPSPTSYCFPAVENVYNLFHKSDPVAYRMEPLIARQYGTKQPVQVAYIKGGLKSAFETVYNSYSSFKFGFKLPFGLNWEATSSKKSNEDRSNSKIHSDPAEGEDIVLDTIRSSSSGTSQGAAKISKLNRTGRVDYCLQEGFLENAYFSALSVHMNYWQDLDVAGFLVQEIYRKT